MALVKVMQRVGPADRRSRHLSGVGLVGFEILIFDILRGIRFGQAHRQHRRGGCIQLTAARGLGVVRIHEREAGPCTELEPVIEGFLEVQAHRVLVLLGPADDTAVAVITQGEGVGQGLGTAGNRKVIALAGTRLDGVLLPVDRSDLQPGAVDRVLIYFLEDLGLVLVLHVLHELVEIEHFQLLGDITVVQAGAETHGRTLLVSHLGGDQDDAVGAERAVNGGGGSVLEDLDALDIHRVETGKAVDVLVGVTGLEVGVTHQVHHLRAALGRVDDDTVHDIERFRITVERVHASDTDGDTGIGTAVVGGHLYAGDISLQHLVDGLDTAGQLLVDLDARHGAGEVAFAHGTITHDDRLFQLFVIILERERHAGASAHGQGLLRIAEAGDRQPGVFDGSGDRERVSSIRIGGRTHGRAPLDHHDGTDDGLPVTVLDNTGNFYLGVHLDARQDHDSSQETAQ